MDWAMVLGLDEDSWGMRIWGRMRSLVEDEDAVEG